MGFRDPQGGLKRPGEGFDAAMATPMSAGGNIMETKISNPMDEGGRTKH